MYSALLYFSLVISGHENPQKLQLGRVRFSVPLLGVSEARVPSTSHGASVITSRCFFFLDLTSP